MAAAPKVLRSFLRHDRTLFADIGRLIFDILSSYFSQAAGKPIQTAMVSRATRHSAPSPSGILTGMPCGGQLVRPCPAALKIEYAGNRIALGDAVGQG